MNPTRSSAPQLGDCAGLQQVLINAQTEDVKVRITWLGLP